MADMHNLPEIKNSFSVAFANFANVMPSFQMTQALCLEKLCKTHTHANALIYRYMNKYVKWGIMAVVAVGLTVLGVRNFMPHENAELNEAPKGGKGMRNKVLPVKYYVVKPQALRDAIEVSGSLLPDEEVNLSFEKAGKITEIHFTEGAHVKQGQLLAKINDAPQQAQLRKLEAQLKLMQDRLYRQRALLEKEAVSKEAFQQAEANLQGLRAEMDMVRAEIAQTELRAPFDGVVGLRKVSKGTYATTSTTVATLTKNSPLKLEFNVPERYAGLLKPGAGVTFTVEGDLTPRHAKVYATNSQVDVETRTYTIRAHYPNAGGALVPGRYVSITLNAREYPNTLAVPATAVISEMGIDKVFLCKNGTAQPAEIAKGLRTDAEVQVLRGLAVGDTVITSGTMQLRTGQKVKLTN